MVNDEPLDYDELFCQSYERVVGPGVGITDQGELFFARFYDNFLATSPTVAEKFKGTDMQRQGRMLQKSMYQLIAFYFSHSESDYLKMIAETHSQAHYDIEPGLYDDWLDSLVETVREFDSEFSERLELAWRLVMTPGIVFLKHFYKRDES